MVVKLSISIKKNINKINTPKHVSETLQVSEEFVVRSNVFS